jgi:hypothetical protein
MNYSFFQSTTQFNFRDIGWLYKQEALVWDFPITITIPTSYENGFLFFFLFDFVCWVDSKAASGVLD